MKGIILAGGYGTRLAPMTQVISKHLLPVYDKPQIYYPVSVLMLTGVREILIISTPHDLPLFRRLFGDGTDLGLRIDYAEQARPNGIAEALVVGDKHIGSDTVALVLGDNVFHGPGFSATLQRARDLADNGCVLFGYPVRDPRRYAIGVTAPDGRLQSIEEKPSNPRTNRAITGLYFYNNEVLEIAKNVKRSPRGELEITDVNRVYVERGQASLIDLGRGFAWLDTGTHDSLLEAGHYVQVLERRQGVRIACLEEIALHMGYIDADSCYRLGARYPASGYGQYIMEIARNATMSHMSHQISGDGRG